MDIPEKDWQYRDWIEYIIENRQKVFSSKKENMLKIYYIHANERSIRYLLQNSKKFGEFYVITIDYQPSTTKLKIPAEYWIHQKEPGLLMLFTSSTQEGYEKTLKNKLKKVFGLYKMWIKPETFKKVRQDLIENKDCGIVKFYAERKRYDSQVKSYVKENADRWIHYRTSNKEDGIKRLKEMEYHLGVSVKSIDYVYQKSRIQITTEGLFHLKNINEKAFELMDYVIEKIREEENQMRKITQSIDLQIEKNNNVENYLINPGKIEFNEEQDEESTNELISKLNTNFIFVEPKIINSDPILLMSEVIDKNKGTIFSINAFKNTIVLMPKYHITFESFLEFYKLVVEKVDENARLLPFSETFA
jgi:hypothetical protein